MNKNKTLWTLFFYSPALCFFKVLLSLAGGNYCAVKIIPYVMGLFIGDGYGDVFPCDEKCLKPIIEKFTGMSCNINENKK